jgi:hypothetical protein
VGRVADQIAGLAALLALYLAWFVYEDEERRIQSRLEDWWLEIDEASASARAKSAALLALVLKKLAALLEKMVGPRILSLRGWSVAVPLAQTQIRADGDRLRSSSRRGGRDRAGQPG